jgi:hypothetical protein
MKNFVVVVDGEAVTSFAIPDSLEETAPLYEYFEKMIAALSSNPIIIQSDEKILEGSTWDGTSFTPPV